MRQIWRGARIFDGETLHDDGLALAIDDESSSTARSTSGKQARQQAESSNSASVEVRVNTPSVKPSAASTKAP